MLRLFASTAGTAALVLSTVNVAIAAPVCLIAWGAVRVLNRRVEQARREIDTLIDIRAEEQALERTAA